MSLINSLKWRYATKKYDTSARLTEEEIAQIKEATQLSASSYGLQPYKIIELKDSSLKETLKPLTWGQGQVTDAAEFWVFCNKVEVTDEDVDTFTALRAKTTGLELEALAGYATFVKGKMKEKSADEMQNWTARQTYIALGNALAAAAELQIDATPMEGFESEKYAETLGLAEDGYNACVLLALGKRHEEDTTQHAAKTRKFLDDLFEAR